MKSEKRAETRDGHPGNSTLDQIPTVGAAADPRRDAPSAPAPAYAKAVGTRSDDAERALRKLHVLITSTRLYERTHPQTLQSLDEAYEAIRSVSSRLKGFDVKIERGRLRIQRTATSPYPTLAASCKLSPRISIAPEFTRSPSPGNFM